MGPRSDGGAVTMRKRSRRRSWGGEAAGSWRTDPWQTDPWRTDPWWTDPWQTDPWLCAPCTEGCVTLASFGSSTSIALQGVPGKPLSEGFYFS